MPRRSRSVQITKREQILRAATNVFSTREFHAVPVEDVAVAAGVGKGTLYLYFPTKEQLFYATILDALDVLIAELRAAVVDRDGEDALTAFVACMLDFFRRRRPLAMLMHRYEHRLREPEGMEWRARRAQMVELARALVASCVALRPGAATLATEMLLASVRAAVLNQPDGEPYEGKPYEGRHSGHTAETVVHMFLHGVGAVRGDGKAARRGKGAPRARRRSTTMTARTTLGFGFALPLVAPALVGLALVGFALLAASCADHATTATETAPAQPPIAVAVVPVTSATVERTADLVGSFFANEEVTVASQIESRVVWLGADMGDHVAQGDVIVRFDDADLQAQLREVEARLVRAHDDDERARSLRASGVMSRQEAERMWSDAAVLEAQRDLLKVKLDRTVIHAPLGGGIAVRFVSVGEIAQIGRPLFKIMQDDPLKFRTPIPERFASFLHVGQEVRLGIAAYADRRFAGKITRINPAAEEANRSIVIEAEVPNPDGLIKPGFFGSGEIVYDSRAPALVVPDAALTTFAGLTKLFVVKDGKAEERVVRAGMTVGEHQREITDGVAEGEEVAVTNVDRLENGAAVTVTRGEPVATAGQ